jgi:hypothetical protein
VPLVRAQRVQFPRESIPVGPPLHDEAAVSTPRTVVREAEEGKRLGPPVTARLSELGGQLPELDKACFVFVEHQATCSEALTKVGDHLPCVRLVLEAHDEVVGVTDDDDSPMITVKTVRKRYALAERTTWMTCRSFWITRLAASIYRPDRWQGVRLVRGASGAKN